VHLLCAIVSFGLLSYATFLLINSDKLSPEQLALIFGATGMITISVGRIAYFFDRAFRLVERILEKMSGIGTEQ
jgi:hypothetical protein